MIRVGAVHGIGNDSASRSSLAARWGGYLIEAGVDAMVDVAEWDSSGSPIRDLARIVTAPEWVNRQRDAVMSQLRDIRPHIVIAHSFGAVLASGITGRAPIVAIGSPIGHALYGRALSMRGNASVPPSSYDCFNDEDDVASSRVWGRRDTSALGWTPVRVAVAGRGAFAAEHRDDLYLRHPVVLNIVRHLARRAFTWTV
jgi:pimeloyl-ACP methyl ester carboxylesterase